MYVRCNKSVMLLNSVKVFALNFSLQSTPIISNRDIISTANRRPRPVRIHRIHRPQLVAVAIINIVNRHRTPALTTAITTAIILIPVKIIIRLKIRATMGRTAIVEVVMRAVGITVIITEAMDMGIVVVEDIIVTTPVATAEVNILIFFMCNYLSSK